MVAYSCERGGSCAAGCLGGISGFLAGEVAWGPSRSFAQSRGWQGGRAGRLPCLVPREQCFVSESAFSGAAFAQPPGRGLEGPSQRAKGGGGRGG